MSANPDETLAKLAESEPEAALWCASVCVGAVLHYLPVEEHRPRQAVEPVGLWASGKHVPIEETQERLREAEAALVQYDNDPSPIEVYCVCSAAMWLIGAMYYRQHQLSFGYPEGVHRDFSTRVGSSVYSCRRALIWSWSRRNGDQEWSAEAYAWSGCHLNELIEHQLSPVVVAPMDLARARPGAQVAWDWLTERYPAQLERIWLGTALLIARRHGLDWCCPVERAIAERVSVFSVTMGEWAQIDGILKLS